jgi:hypothetical protein
LADLDRAWDPIPLPKHAAWLNLVEGFWKILTQRAWLGRTCRSPGEVATALQAGVADWNGHPTPFLWVDRHARAAGSNRCSPSGFEE